MENGGTRTTAPGASRGIICNRIIRWSNIAVKNSIIPGLASGAAVLGQRFLDTHHYNIHTTLVRLCAKSPCVVKQTFVFSDRDKGRKMEMRKNSNGIGLAVFWSVWIACFSICAFFHTSALLSDEARFRRFEQTKPTYPYSAPVPFPVLSSYYPYFRFDGYSVEPQEHAWKTIELSNGLLSLEILPEIGGKIWTATDLVSGRAFFYSNPVVKFRDVGMRGPWTSGGLEMNAGIIGHAPTTSSAVDCAVRKNADGSVSCFIGALDLITRTTWRVEIKLGESQRRFSTSVFRENISGFSQPYYTWMNLGVKAEHLRVIFPGTAFIGHEGGRSDWPIDPKFGRDLSVYENNTEGSYKSYHVLGTAAEFFGAYYDNEDFGMAAVAHLDAKRGRKIWNWGLSREGMIWEDLLTDPPGGQYVELQTGRLFNQVGTSAGTPFTRRSFEPCTAESWTEWWMPVARIGGFDTASEIGAMRVKIDEEGKNVTVAISPAVRLDTSIELFDDADSVDSTIASQQARLVPEEPFIAQFTLEKAPKRLSVRVGGDLLIWKADGIDTLSRPLVSPKTEAAKRLSDQWRAGLELERERLFDKADALFQKCLELDSGFVPAYVALGENALRHCNDEQARDFALNALALETYDGPANLLLGNASLALGAWADAAEAFSVAAMSADVRLSAYVGLGTVFLAQNQNQRALEAFENAVRFDAQSSMAALGKLVALRRLGRLDEHDALCVERLDADPLAHFARFERLLSGKESAEGVYAVLTGELPHETFLEMAVAYAKFGGRDDAARILRTGLAMEGIHPTAMLYHLADYAADDAALEQAQKSPAAFHFPFRPESLDVYRRAAERGKSWKNRYALAVELAALGHKDEAKKIVADEGNTPDEAVFYAFRGSLDESRRLDDFLHVLELDDSHPRYALELIEEYQRLENWPEMLAAAEKYQARFSTDARIALFYTEALSKNGRNADALAFLETTVILPNEGATAARSRYHRVCLELAAERFRAKEYAEVIELAAKGRLWPENLGAGKPQQERCNERLEDFIDANARAALDGKPPIPPSADWKLADWEKEVVRAFCE